jgi:lipopolysaccharide transport system ATP-binding protein
MTRPAITVERLGKRYKLGLTHAGSIREAVNRSYQRLTGRRRNQAANGNIPSNHEPGRVDEAGCFWALQDVSFDVRPGEVVGIIGKNGAGKSTLLKILSRITKPTTGRCTLRGRVASLLEVGTGFHPELTGRENVYMNATILGMSKREVDRRFDEIIAFAELAQFIDTPVKRYSSGMTVRLGFAIAAHLEPEILIVDEVLAVGDVAFQRRCIEKLDTVAHSGKTVLFVSHNLGAVQSLCRRSLLITSGHVAADGATSEVVARYHATDKGTVALRSVVLGDRDPIATLQIMRVATSTEQGDEQSAFCTGVAIRFTAELLCRYPIATHLAFAVHDAAGHLVINMLSLDADGVYNLPGGRQLVSATLRRNCLRDGTYYLSVWAGHSLESEPYAYWPSCLCFYIDNSGVRKIYSAAIVHADAQWSVTRM